MCCPPSLHLILLPQVSVHALTTAFAVLEIRLPRTLPLPLLHRLFVILLLLLYLALAYLTHAISHFYVYNFLNTGALGAGTVTGYCIAILAGVCVVFGFVWALIWLKARIVGDSEDDVEPRNRRNERGMREGAQGRAGMRRSRGMSDVEADLSAPPPVFVRPPHTRSVSGITAVNDDQDLEMGPETTSAVSSPSSSSPRSPRRGEVVELDAVTSEFMRETALGRSKTVKK